VLLGVSRSGKTPTCLYLALHYGIYAANYPLTEEDLDRRTAARPGTATTRAKLFGLTIEPSRLQQIRQARRPDSRYASAQQVQLRAARSRAACTPALACRTPMPRIARSRRSPAEFCS
jgi:[pyruvate, water dikinase]-phosphate phosphotransferase / [pyruvate, water dikinase] kinase